MTGVQTCALPISWQASQSSTASNGGIVLDDVRKFRRSARVSGSGAPGGVNGGALGGMYDERQQQDQQREQQSRQLNQHQQQSRAGHPSQFNSMQQNAINLGLGGLPHTPARQSHANNNQSHLANLAAQLPPLGSSSPGGLLAQQAAVAAQANWRNGLGSPTGPPPHHGHGSPLDHLDQYGNAQSHGGFASPASANVQLANLFALQQQMQLQQLQMAHASGIALTPVQLMGLQQQQGLLSPNSRMMNMGGMNGMNGMGGMGMGGMGMGGMMGVFFLVQVVLPLTLPRLAGGMGSPRRSPRSATDRSPGGNSKTNMPSAAGSGSNPDEAIDLTLLGDIPAWLRSLRLHKYTPNFEHSHWKEMVMLDDAGLEGKGVGALGARRKLLKARLCPVGSRMSTDRGPARRYSRPSAARWACRRCPATAPCRPTRAPCARRPRPQARPATTATLELQSFQPGTPSSTRLHPSSFQRFPFSVR